jgi:hypothetical protein
MVARDHRRRGIGLALMEAAEEWARRVGVRKLELHVFPHNTPALALYEKLGYERVRDLEVWDIKADRPPSTARETDAREAHERIRAARRTREPWQRADATLEHLLESEALLGLVVDGAAAVTRASGRHGSVEQVATENVDAATDVLAGGLARYGRLRLSNIPVGDEAALALARLEDAPLLRQHELRLNVA